MRDNTVTIVRCSAKVPQHILMCSSCWPQFSAAHWTSSEDSAKSETLTEKTKVIFEEVCFLQEDCVLEVTGYSGD